MQHSFRTLLPTTGTSKVTMMGIEKLLQKGPTPSFAQIPNLNLEMC